MYKAPFHAITYLATGFLLSVLPLVGFADDAKRSTIERTTSYSTLRGSPAEPLEEVKSQEPGILLGKLERQGIVMGYGNTINTTAPARNYSIIIYSFADESVTTTTTNSNGQFRTTLAPGKYRIVAELPFNGGLAKSEDFPQEIVISAGQTLSIYGFIQTGPSAQ